MTTRIETVVLDMAGTTVVDDGVVVDAFERAWDRERPDDAASREDAVTLVHDTMGQSKIAVFRMLVSGPEAEALNTAFETAYAELIAEGRAAAIDGAAEAIADLRAQGRRVVLTTGFARPTADAIIHALRWEDVADLVLTPAEAGRGRPAPDLNLVALLRTGASSVDAVAVVGDTPSDARSARAAGAGLAVGVLTGGSEEAALRDAGATEILASVRELPGLLTRLGR